MDYVPSESNPADVPSRVHSMTAAEAGDALEGMGDPVALVVPSFATADGRWLSYVEIARSVWSN